MVSNTYNRGCNIIKLFKNLVKPYLISNTKNTVHVLRHKMPNGLRFKALESWKTFEKSQNWMNTEPGALFALLEKNLAIAVKNYVKQVSKFSVPVRFCLIFSLCLIYFVS